MSNFKPITGTFVNTISEGIMNSNWTPEQWEKQFDNFEEIGIDTAIILHVGWKNNAMYKSKVMKTTLYDDEDMVEVMCRAAQRTGIDLYIGLFNTQKHWCVNDWDSEVAINKELISEILERYSRFKSFAGWYLCHEGAFTTHPYKIWKPLVEEIRKHDTFRKILCSSRFEGIKCDPINPVPPEVKAKQFDYVLNQMEDMVDACLFMDGHVGFDELENYVRKMSNVFEKHDVEMWSNLETFDRDMIVKFPPIEWAKMKHKLEVVQPYVEKIVTYQVPHFLSPYSIFPSARNLYQRYMSYISKNGKSSIKVARHV